MYRKKRSGIHKETYFGKTTMGRPFFNFDRSHDVHRESCDMGYEIFLNILKNHGREMQRWCIKTSKQREGGGASSSRGKYDAWINGKLSDGGTKRRKETPAKAVTVWGQRVPRLPWKINLPKCRTSTIHPGDDVTREEKTCGETWLKKNQLTVLFCGEYLL